MTETSTPAAPATLEAIRARYRQIAPPVEPGSPSPVWDLSRSLLLSALRGWAVTLSPDGAMDHKVISAMLSDFAALHLLRHLQSADPEAAARLAREIASAWDDGGGVGERLWEHARPLGIDTDEVSALTTAEARLRVATGASEAKAGREAAARFLSLSEAHERVMFAAWIDLRRGDPDAARQLLNEQLEGHCDVDGPEWSGETGAQWLAKATAEAEIPQQREPVRM
jgi:hypothetical protein